MTPWNPPATYLILNVCKVLSRNTGSHPFPDLEKAAPQNTTGECSDPDAFAIWWGGSDQSDHKIHWDKGKAPRTARIDNSLGMVNKNKHTARLPLWEDTFCQGTKICGSHLYRGTSQIISTYLNSWKKPDFNMLSTPKHLTRTNISRSSPATDSHLCEAVSGQRCEATGQLRDVFLLQEALWISRAITVHAAASARSPMMLFFCWREVWSDGEAKPSCNFRFLDVHIKLYHTICISFIVNFLRVSCRIIWLWIITNTHTLYISKNYTS